MATFGRACLILGLAVALYGVAASLHGARTRRPEWIASGRRAVYALAGLAVAAFVVLEAAFLRSDFSFSVVATHSSTTTPTFYKVTAPWSSQEGSLLLWLMLLALWSSLVLFLTRRSLRAIAPYATAVLLGLGAFFCALLVFLESPFGQNAVPPPEGTGLNPLLRHPSMATHPVALYSGYTLFAVPFAFAVGALVTRSVGAEWIRATRRFSLAAWLALGIGIVLGARWSYVELGWGGYWAWDPVENASLMPWLTGTAFLHSVMIQEKRGMLRVWNVSLVLATGVLAVMGTFLVRSGILDSIHAFGASTLGIPFLCLIAVLVAGSVYLVTSRRSALRSEHRLDSLLSREAIFLGNNVVLVALAAVVFFGTFFPLIAEALTGDRASVGPPWFNRWTVPLTLVLVLLSGLAPLMAWRRATRAAVRRNLALPAVVLVAALAALAPFTIGKPLAWLMFGIAAFVLASVGQEFWRGTRARRAMSGEPAPVALVSLVRRNRRRYGGYLVHVGVAVLFVGVAASSAFETARDVTLRPGQAATVDGYEVRYTRPTAEIVTDDRSRVERIALGAVLDVRKGDQRFRLRSERGYYPTTDTSVGPVGQFFEGEAVSEIGLRAGWLNDLWVAYASDGQAIKRVTDALDRRLRDAPAAQQQRAVVAFTALMRDRPPPATFRVLSSPMVTWIWLGAIILLLGGVVALWPAADAARRKVGAAYRARVARELEPV